MTSLFFPAHNIYTPETIATRYSGVKSFTMIADEQAMDVSREPLHQLRLENSLVRTYWIDLAPGVATQFHRHERPYAGICVGDSKIRNEIVGTGAAESDMHDGDVIFTSGHMTHRIENIGESAFQNVTIEVLRSAGHKTSSLKRLERERRHIQISVDERALRVANLELAAGERCDLIGDHLVIWLRGEAKAATFERSWMLRRAGDFAWLCGMATVESIEGARVAIAEIA